jgi:Zn-dependent peptidase ImmA (M78 family)
MDAKTLDAKAIDNDALALLKTVFSDIDSIKLPIDLNRIVNHCKLTIRQGEFHDSNLEGALDRTSRTIFLSENDTFEGKNFTLAHELGHFKLHSGIKTDIFTMHQLNDLLIRQGDDPKEDQADLFASCLLMPEKSVRSLWDAANKDIEMLSKIFGVPVVVAEFRLRNLKLL